MLPRLLLVSSVGLVAAQSVVYPTTAASSAAPLATGTGGYTYIGCWNETTGFSGDGGARALEDGNSTTSNTMTIDECLAFCGDAQYAGLEYGRECYCGEYIAVLSTKLNASSCDLACDGNASEICGGSLSLTLYNLTSKSDGAGRPTAGSSAAWYATAAVLGLMFAAVL